MLCYLIYSTPSLNQYMPFTPMLHEAVKLLDSIPERYEDNIDLLKIIGILSLLIHLSLI
jgi:hypothetical protein